LFFVFYATNLYNMCRESYSSMFVEFGWDEPCIGIFNLRVIHMIRFRLVSFIFSSCSG
jgi:hypothetical protein